MEYLAIIAFAIITCVTPGPNNAMIMASGLNYGIRRSIPHYLGICLGFPAMVMAVGLGLANLFQQYPLFHIGLKVVGAAYLCFLAWKIASAPVSKKDETAGKPFTFLQAAAFQWVNPKAWILTIGAIATYTVIGEGYFWQVLLIALIFLGFGSPCILLWLWFGTALQRLLHKPVQLRLFNVTMATLLVLSLTPVFFDLYQQFQSA